jgi:hypothetical protein
MIQTQQLLAASQVGINSYDDPVDAGLAATRGYDLEEEEEYGDDYYGDDFDLDE